MNYTIVIELQGAKVDVFVEIGPHERRQLFRIIHMYAKESAKDTWTLQQVKKNRYESFIVEKGIEWFLDFIRNLYWKIMKLPGGNWCEIKGKYIFTYDIHEVSYINLERVVATQPA